MNTYIVPAIERIDVRGEHTSTVLTANVEPGVSWVGQPIENRTKYLIRTPHDLPELPPGRERGERARLNAQQMRNTAQANGLVPDDIEHRWFVWGGD